MAETTPLEKRNVLVACTGSVASLKMPLLVEQLQSLPYDLDIQIVPTEHSQHFFDPKSLPVKVHYDQDEWTTWQTRTDPVLHIELRRWADIMVIAPLDANTMAKLCHGICDNLLTCVVRAWDMSKPLLFAPAMNTHMWNHPLTATQVASLKAFGYQEIPCIEKTLVCGDTGFGAMAEVPDIVARVKETLIGINNVQPKV